MTIDDKIRDEKLQFDTQPANIGPQDIVGEDALLQRPQDVPLKVLFDHPGDVPI